MRRPGNSTLSPRTPTTRLWISYRQVRWSVRPTPNRALPAAADGYSQIARLNGVFTRAV